MNMLVKDIENGTLEDCIPLFTEGQLRKFIQDFTGGIVKVVQWNPSMEDMKDDDKYGYRIYVLAKSEYRALVTFEFEKVGTDLLKAYWNIACKIALNKKTFFKTN